MKALTKLVALMAAFSMVASTQAFADEANTEENKTAVKAEDVKPKDGKKADDIDSEITNKKLRAELGSKSKYSMSMSMSYSGGSIAKPLSKDRPNISKSKVAPAVNLSGNVGGRYRLDKGMSISAGTGITVVQPFHAPQADQNDKSYLDKAELSDPYVSFSKAGSVGRLQVINSATLTAYTNDRSLSVNSVADLTVANTLLTPVGKSKLQVGLASYIWGGYFSGTTSKGKDIKGFQADYGVAFYPFMEYAISDTFDFRTVFQQFQFWHSRDKTKWDAFDRGGQTQSVGLGISVSRNVYLYPNFQFKTDELSTDWLQNRFAKESTVGLSATINMF